MTTQEIINAFNEHLTKSYKRYYSDFYVGVTSNISQRLFEEHNVPRQGHWYIYRPGDDQTCRDVERFFLAKGMRGDDGGGDNVKYVYCYEVSQSTKE